MALLTFVDTHNMIAFLTKSDAIEGFDQIFWASVSIKKSNDVVKLEALIDRKKVIITEDTIRKNLRLDDADDQSAQPSSPPQQQPSQTADISDSLMTLLNTLMETCAARTQKVANLEQDKIAQALEITKLKQRVRKLEKKMRSKHSSFKRLRKVGRMEDDVTAVKDINAAESEPIVFVDEEGRMEDDVTTVKDINAAESEPIVFVDEEMQEKHLDNVNKYQSLKRKPISIAQARKNMIVYLKNMAGYKIQHFKGMTYDQALPIFKREYKHIQTFLKSYRDEEPTKKRPAKETLLQESFKKLRAEVEVLGSHST
nr:hypothetical protein [Tanacetum cinerariifolium]